MLTNFVFNSLVLYIEDEISNKFTHKNSVITIELDNGKKVKIYAKKII